MLCYSCHAVSVDAAERKVMGKPDQMISQCLLALRSMNLITMFFSWRFLFPQEGTFKCNHPEVVITFGKVS